MATIRKKSRKKSKPEEDTVEAPMEELIAAEKEEAKPSDPVEIKSEVIEPNRPPKEVRPNPFVNPNAPELCRKCRTPLKKWEANGYVFRSCNLCKKTSTQKAS